MQLDYHIENCFTRRECVLAVLKWLSEGDYTPDDILIQIQDQCDIEFRMQPLYVFQKEYHGNAYAELGVGRQESYATHGNTQYRTVTDWVPHNHYAHGTVQVIVYGGERVPEGNSNFYEGISLSDKLVQVHVIDAKFDRLGRLFAYSKEEQWRRTGINYATSRIERGEKNRIRSSSIRNFGVSVEFNTINTHSVVAPYWHFTYSYDNQQFVVLVDGTDLTRIAGSTRPIDRERKRRIRRLKVFSWLSGILLSGAGIFLNLSHPSENLMAVNVGLVVLGIALPWAVVSTCSGRIKIESRKRRQRVLDSFLNS